MRFFKRHNNSKKDVLTDDHDSELVTSDQASDRNEQGSKEESKRSLDDGFFAYIFNLSKHKQTERRFIYYIISLMIILVGMGTSLYHSHNKNIHDAMTLTSYNTSISFSKSGSSMHIEKSFISKDNRTAYVPFYFNSLKNTSTDSNDYRVFVRATNGDLQYKPKGQLVMFGDTGRGTIILKSPTKIQNQPVQFIIRNDKKITSDSSSSANLPDSDSGIQQLASKYDLVTFKVNLNVPSKTKQSGNLNHQSVTPSVIYETLFAKKDMRTISKQIASDEKVIHTDTERALELRRRLERVGFEVPESPNFVNGDWRPFDAVNPNTGQLLKPLPKSVTDQDSVDNDEDGIGDDTTVDASDDPDQVDYPDVLRKPDGTTTEGSAADDDNSDIGRSSSDSTAADNWSDLQTTWDEIKSKKRDIYVTQAKRSATVRGIVKDQDDQSSIGSVNRFSVIGHVQVPVRKSK